MSKGWTAILDGFSYMLEGAWVNLVVVLGALGFGFALGLPMALVQIYSRSALLRTCVGAYVWFFRGIPLLVCLFLFYFGLFEYLGWNLSAFAVGVIVLGLISAAYQSQILRGAILAVSEGQMKAGRALGLADGQTIRLIVLPQALRMAIPGWSNEYSILLKDSAVTYALGVSELMARAHHVASRTYQHLYLYVTAGLLFMTMTWIGTRLLRSLQERLTIPGFSK